MRTWILLLVALPLAAKTQEWERAYTLFEDANFKQASSILEKASQKDFDNLLLLGRCYMELKDYGDAVDAFEKATDLSPKSSVAHLWLGRAFGRQAEANKLLAFGRARKARAAFEKAVELDPKNRDALDDLFEYYFEAPSILGGGLDKAERVAKQIGALDPAAGERFLARIAKKKSQ